MYWLMVLLRKWTTYRIRKAIEKSGDGSYLGVQMHGADVQTFVIVAYRDNKSPHSKHHSTFNRSAASLAPAMPSGAPS